MPEPQHVPDPKRALLEKYLRGEVRMGPSDDPVSSGAVAQPGHSRGRVVPIQIEGSKAPIFFLHGQWKLGGFFCFPLAHALGSDQPFYALDPYCFDGLPIPPALEAIAASHVKSLREARDEGPYVLAGWCNGGLLAYEMARQLYAAGQAIELLILMDPVYLIYPFHLRFARAAINRLCRLTGRGPGRQLSLYLSFRQAYRFLEHVYRYLVFRHYRRSKAFAPFEREDYPGMYDWTAMGYRPEGPFRGQTRFIWSAAQPYRRGWRRVEPADNVEVDVLPCMHATCLDKHIDLLAARMREWLDRLGRPPDGPASHTS